jgi:hypothetical protein
MDGDACHRRSPGQRKELGYTFAAYAQRSILRAASYIPLWSESFVSILGGSDGPEGRWFGGWSGLSRESAEEVTLAWSVAHLVCVVPVQAATRSRIMLVGRPSFR